MKTNPPLIKSLVHTGLLENPITVIEDIFKRNGLSLVQAAFKYSYFLDPQAVRERTPMFPGHARLSRAKYPGKRKGDEAKWQEQTVRLDDNSKAQKAWQLYSGRRIQRATGYGVRHIWGYPWDPVAYTAGWNLCYMPFWVGMLTEDQHPHPELQQSIQQASYDLFFRHNPVCDVPNFIKDPGIDLGKLLDEQPVLILGKQPFNTKSIRPALAVGGKPAAYVLALRKQKNISWAALLKAIQCIQGISQAGFDSSKVEVKSKNIVRRMVRQTGWNMEMLKNFIELQLSYWKAI